MSWTGLKPCMRDRSDQVPEELPNSPWALVAVMAVVLMGVAQMVFGLWRGGAIFVGGAAVLAALLRVVLPEHLAGLLAVRRRWIDVLALTLIGVAIIVMALQVPPGR